MKGRRTGPILRPMRSLSRAVPLLLLALAAAPAAAQREGADSLDAPPASAAPASEPGEPAGEDTPFDADRATPPPPADGAAPDAAPDAAIPPPPAPAAGYGTPVYPGPSGEAPGFVVAEGVRLPSNLATRLRVIDSSLSVLAARGGNRIVDGVLSMVSGGVSIGLGIYARHIEEVEIARYAFVMGSVYLAGGIIDLALTPNPRTQAIQFSHMPMRTLEEAEARLAYGERALENLARRSRQVRVIDASLSIASGIAVAPLFLHPKDYEFTDPLDYFIIVAAGISVITGIINLATRSDAERRWDAYEELGERLDTEEAAGALAETPRGPRILGGGVSPVQGGATAGVVVGF